MKYRRRGQFAAPKEWTGNWKENGVSVAMKAGLNVASGSVVCQKKIAIYLIRYGPGLRRVAGSFQSHGRRPGEKRLCPRRQRDLQEAEETVRLQKWPWLCGDQEAEPLPVHQRGLFMVSRCLCGILGMPDSIPVCKTCCLKQPSWEPYPFQQWLWLLPAWEHLRVCETI